MAATKEIAVTFLYADEAIFDYMNSNGRLTKMVDWANQFYGQYNFKLNIYPTTFNLKKYKEDYCYAKTNGPEYLSLPWNPSPVFVGLNFIFSSLTDHFFTRMDEAIKNVSIEYASTLVNQSYIKEQYETISTCSSAISAISAVKKKFRDADEARLRRIVDHWKVPLDKNRIPILFLNFIDTDKILGSTITDIGQTFDDEDHEALIDRIVYPKSLAISIALKNAIAQSSQFRAFVVMDPEESTSTNRTGVLAHEIVHCVHSSTEDNEGGKDSIMNYDNLYANAKTPTKLKLDKDDEAKIKTAYFVKVLK